MEYQNWELIISGEYILWWDHHNEGIKKKFGFMHLTYKQSLHKPDQVRRKIIIQQANLEHTTNIYICRNTNRKKKKYTTSFFFFLPLNVECISFWFSFYMAQITSWRTILGELYGIGSSLILSSQLKKILI